MPGTSEWLSSLKDRIRSGEDCTDDLDDLFQVTFSGDDDEVQEASWCLARMAAAGCSDMRLSSILMSMRDVSDPVSENVCWGLGELASSGIGGEDELGYAVRMHASERVSLRAMAVWCIGRLRDAGISSDASDAVLRDAAADENPMVRACAIHGLP